MKDETMKKVTRTLEALRYLQVCGYLVGDAEAVEKRMQHQQKMTLLRFFSRVESATRDYEKDDAKNRLVAWWWPLREKFDWQ